MARWGILRYDTKSTIHKRKINKLDVIKFILFFWIDVINFKNIVLQKILLREWKDKLKTGRKYLQTKVPSKNKFLEQTWYIHTMNYYSRVKKNELLTHTAAWTDLKSIHILYDSINITFLKWQNNRNDKPWVVARGQRQEYGGGRCQYKEGAGRSAFVEMVVVTQIFMWKKTA